MFTHSTLHESNAQRNVISMHLSEFLLGEKNIFRMSRKQLIACRQPCQSEKIQLEISLWEFFIFKEAALEQLNDITFEVLGGVSFPYSYASN